MILHLNFEITYVQELELLFEYLIEMYADEIYRSIT